MGEWYEDLFGTERDYKALYHEALKINADLVASLNEQKAEAWDEGWMKGQHWAFSDLDEDDRDSNPYRKDDE